DPDRVVKDSVAASQHRLIVDFKGDTQSRLEVRFLSVPESAIPGTGEHQTARHVKLVDRQFGNRTLCVAGERLSFDRIRSGTVEAADGAVEALCFRRLVFIAQTEIEGKG